MARRGSAGSDLPDINEDFAFNEPLPDVSTSGRGDGFGGGGGGSGFSTDSLGGDTAGAAATTSRGYAQVQGSSSSGSKPIGTRSSGGGSGIDVYGHGNALNMPRVPPGGTRRRTTWSSSISTSTRLTGAVTGTTGGNADASAAVVAAAGLVNIIEGDSKGVSSLVDVGRRLSERHTSTTSRGVSHREAMPSGDKFC